MTDSYMGTELIWTDDPITTESIFDIHEIDEASLLFRNRGESVCYEIKPSAKTVSEICRDILNGGYTGTEVPYSKWSYIPGPAPIEDLKWVAVWFAPGKYPIYRNPPGQAKHYLISDPGQIIHNLEGRTEAMCSRSEMGKAALAAI